jgi:hypothetical protein
MKGAENVWNLSPLPKISISRKLSLLDLPIEIPTQDLFLFALPEYNQYERSIPQSIF